MCAFRSRDKAEMIWGIVNKLILSTHFLRSVESFLDPRFLMEPGFIRVARYCFKYYKEHGKAPGETNMWKYFDENCEQLPIYERESIKQILEDIELKHLDESDMENDIKLVEKWCEQQKQERIQAKQIDEHVGAKKLLKKYLSAREAVIELEDRGFTAYELSKMDLPELEWIIDGVIAEGLTIIAGKPKVGKSYFMFNACLDLASGSDVFGAIPTEPKEVLYLALESKERLLKGEQDKILEGREAPDKLHIQVVDSWPEDKGIKAFEEWMILHPDTRLIVIDTLEAFKQHSFKSSHKNFQGTQYEKEYGFISPLKEFAEKHHIAVVLIHHCRKTKAKDNHDEIIGSMGLQGVADVLATLVRTNNEKDRLFTYRGRGIGEGELTFKYDDYQYTLAEKRNVSEAKVSKERQAIIDYIEEYDRIVGEPITRKRLIEGMRKEGQGKSVDVLLRKLVEDEHIEKINTGLYARKGYTLQRKLEKERDELVFQILARSRDRKRKTVQRA